MPLVHVKPSVAAQGCPSCRHPELWFPARNEVEPLAPAPVRSRTGEVAAQHTLRKNLIEVGLPELAPVAWDSEDEYFEGDFSILGGQLADCI